MRLAPPALKSLLDRLDSREDAYRGKNRRGSRRFPYRGRTACVQFLEVDGASKIFEVPTRNISGIGIAFLHGGFVHKGVRCRLRLVSLDRKWAFLEGCVAWCRYIDGRAHDLGIRFVQPIDLALFVESTSVVQAYYDGVASHAAPAASTFRAELPVKAKAIIAAAGIGDWVRVAQSARVLKAEAESFRLNAIRDAARRLEEAIVSRHPPEVVGRWTIEVERACHAAARQTDAACPPVSH